MNTAPRPPPAVSFEARIVLRPRSLDETLDLALAYFRAAGRDHGIDAGILVQHINKALYGVRSHHLIRVEKYEKVTQRMARAEIAAVCGHDVRGQ